MKKKKNMKNYKSAGEGSGSRKRKMWQVDNIS